MGWFDSLGNTPIEEYHPDWQSVYNQILAHKRKRYYNRNNRYPEQNYTYTGIAENIEREAAREATEAIRKLRSFE